MKYGRLAALTVTIALSASTAALASDPGRIDAYVTPYYNFSGPDVKVGKYSGGLASSNQATFVATILQMKQRWMQLTFAELYVGAIRLYDLGYRKEATYWFYTAQYKGRQFAMLADPTKLGSMGDPGFELYQAQNAFFEVVGPDINGYAFGDIDSVIAIIRRVQNENRTVSNLQSIYPAVAFVSKSRWASANAGLNAGLGKLASQLAGEKIELGQQRAQNGTQARFARLTSKRFPGGY
ncbi:MAG: hypothetical protein JO113_05270 [Candidatus Eremiobacteraeota bacterium]|nr:hypothetical protein [Candidatus Eremiobacteraeota bacterium]